MSKIKVLADIESIQKRPGWIIGATDSPEQLVHEVLDNALDEIAHNYADAIKLIIENDEIVVMDSGRGIEISTIKFEGKKYDSIVLLCTKLFSGSKFEMTDKEYSFSIGQHGVGLTAVNALSEFMNIYIRDRIHKNIIHKYRFRESNFIDKIQIEDVDSELGKFNTVVHFKPHFKYFDTISIEQSIFLKRLQLASFKFPNSKFYMNDELIKISEEEFIKKELKTDKFIKLEASGGRKQNITVWINYDIDPDKIIIGDVNLKICEGKYLEYLQNNIKKSLNSKFKIKNSNDLLLGLKLYASLIFPEPEFDSQTKRRMESRKVKPLIDKLNSKLDSFLFQDEILEIINSHINQKYNKKIKSPSKRLSAANKVRDCNKIPGEVLYLLEGESADGTLKQIKDRETEASLPLKGKILNVAKSSLQQIYDNEEIKNLLEALGEPKSRRYKKIKILCDADADGHHIICLLLLILQKFAPDMIKEHKVSILLPPLYGAKNKKEFIPIYDESDLEQYKTKYNITRFKGLGKMNPIELEKVIRNGREYIVSLPLNTEELLKIITSTEVKKKLLNSPDTDLKIILDLAK